MQQIKEFYANSGNIPIPDLDHLNIYKNLINVRCKEATSYRFPFNPLFSTAGVVSLAGFPCISRSVFGSVVQTEGLGGCPPFALPGGGSFQRLAMWVWINTY
jgi:hypothetical protein